MRYRDIQIMEILKGAESGIPSPSLCHEHGMSRAIFNKWRTECGGIDAAMIARLKELEAENQRLKKMYAEAELKAEIIQEALRKMPTAKLNEPLG